jgi:nucleotide-binding universal stress UspA family protein
MIQQILIAWDGSAPAHYALDLAIDFARRYEAELAAVSVAHSPAHAETEADRAESVGAARRYLEGTFAAVADRAGRVGVPLHHIVIEGDRPADDILGYAHEHGFDLVVVGHHRNRRSGRFFLHGLAERMIAYADIPILVVSAEDDART